MNATTFHNGLPLAQVITHLRAGSPSFNADDSYYLERDPTGPNGRQTFVIDAVTANEFRGTASIYASVSADRELPFDPDVEADDDLYAAALNIYRARAEELILATPFAGEWLGDEWVLWMDFSFRSGWVYDLDSGSTVAEDTARRLREKAAETLAPAVAALRALHKVLDEAAVEAVQAAKEVMTARLLPPQSRVNAVRQLAAHEAARLGLSMKVSGEVGQYATVALHRGETAWRALQLAAHYAIRRAAGEPSEVGYG